MRAHSILKYVMVLFLILSCSSVFANSEDFVDDSVITAKVKSKIMLTKPLSNLNVSVTTSKGVVKLAGEVDSDSQASALVELVESTDGVKDVDTNDLHVRGSNAPLSDSLITAKVKGMFIQKKLFSHNDIAAMTIHVETNNGIVYLSGTATNQEQINNAIHIAKSIKGVKGVESHVVINKS
jgi:hyperosmotically inducible periplasmic protein